MQPNEKLTVEERIAEIEEANMLFAELIFGDATATEKRLRIQVRLSYLMQRMEDRQTARELREGPYQAPPKKAVVTEDAEL